MWNDRIWFLSASLSAIGVCISICAARYMSSVSNSDYIKNIRTGGTHKFFQMFLGIMCLFVSIFVIVLVSYMFYNIYLVYRDDPVHAGDVILSVLVGAAFGTFVTRFVWALFGPSFGTTEAVLGVGVFVLLSV